MLECWRSTYLLIIVHLHDGQKTEAFRRSFLGGWSQQEKSTVCRRIANVLSRMKFADLNPGTICLKPCGSTLAI